MNRRTSRELEVVGALALCLLGVAGLFLTVLDEHGHYLLVDLLPARVAEASPPIGEGFLATLRSGPVAQQPFRVTVGLARPPEAGDFVAAEREVPADPDETYCVEVLAWSPGRLQNRRSPIEPKYRAVVLAEGTPIGELDLPAEHRGASMRGGGVSAEDGELTLRFEVHVLRRAAQKGWEKDATVHFEHVRVDSC